MDTAPVRLLAGREGAAAASAAIPGPTQATALSDTLLAFRPLVVSIARRYVGANDAEDVAQETLLRAVAHAPDVLDPGKLKPWVCRIAINESMRRARAIASGPASTAGAEQDPEDRLSDQTQSASDPEKIALACWQAEELRRAIRALSGPQQAVIRLHYFDEMSTPEVAASLGIADGAVRKRLMDARRALRLLLGPAFAGGVK